MTTCCCGAGAGVITGVRVDEERVTREDADEFFGCGREDEAMAFALRGGRFDVVDRCEFAKTVVEAAEFWPLDEEINARPL